jgi:hypothetical protein
MWLKENDCRSNWTNDSDVDDHDDNLLHFYDYNQLQFDSTEMLSYPRVQHASPLAKLNVIIGLYS